MPMLGAVGSRIVRLVSSPSAAKAWAQLAQDSLARPVPAERAASIRAR